MAQLIIDVGSAPNDGQGDPIRTAYIKCNDNFSQLYARAQTDPPPTLIGSPGDLAGMYAYDASYFYYCFDNYDGSTVIWAQLASTGNIAGSAINNGNTSVSIPLSNGNAIVTVNGISNIAVFSGAGANIRGFVSASGNITANANVTGSYFFGNGSQLTGIAASYANSNVANYLPVYGGNILASSIIATSQLISDLIIANGNVGTANLNASANISAIGNITGSYFIGNGSQLTGLPASYSNANVANYLPTYSGNITAGNVSVVGNVNGNDLYFTGNGVVVGNLQVQGNLTYNDVSTITTSNLYITLGNNQSTGANLDGAGILVGNNSLATFQFDNLTTSWQSNISVLPKSNALLSLGDGSHYWSNLYATGANIAGNITSTGALSLTGAANVGSVASTGNVSAGGNVLGGNILATGVVSAAGNIFGANLGVTVVSATSNVVAGNIRTSGTVSAAGNITGSYFFGNGSQLTGLPVQYGNSNVADYLPTYTGNLSANVITPAVVSATGNITANYFFGNGSQLTGLPVQYANANVAAYLPTYTGNLGAGNANITGLTTTANLSVTGNSTTGNASVTGNITGGNISAVGNVKSANLSVVGNVNASQISAVGIQTTGVAGNIYGANVITAVTLSATGNVEGQYFIGNGSQLTGIVTSGYANANVFSYLANSNVVISTTGNISGNYIIGNGSQLTGLPASYANSNVQSYGETGWEGNIIPSANITYSLGNSTNWWANAWFGANTIYIGGTPVGVTGNILTVDGANVVTANATGGLSASNVVVTGNITGSYFIGDGSQLTGLPAGYSNTDVSNYLSSGNDLAGYGTAGDISANNIVATSGLSSLGDGVYLGNVSIQGNITVDTFYLGNGSQLTGIYGNTEVEAYLPTSATIGNINSNISNLAGDLSNTNSNVANLQSQVDNLPVIAQIPSVYFTAAANGNSQTFTNVILGGYTSNTSMTIFYNGSLLENSNYTLSGDVLTVNTELVVGDNIDIITTLASNVNNVSSGYGNSNVATYLASNANVIITTTANISGNYIIGDGSQLTNLPGGGNSTAIVNGTTNIAIANANGAITMVVGGTSMGSITTTGVAIGKATSAAANSVSIGAQAGQTGQGAENVAIGRDAGLNNQGGEGVAIGTLAGSQDQGGDAVAIGFQSGTNQQGVAAVAIGLFAGQNSQGNNSIAIGYLAGTTSQPANSIIINATGTTLNGNNAGFYVNPVRNDTGNVANVAFYNTSTQELTYANTINVSGNVTGGNLISSQDIFATGILTLDQTFVAPSAVKMRILVDGDTSFIQVGNGVGGSSGNIAFAPWFDGTGAVVINTLSGNINAGNVLTTGRVSATGNVTGGNILTAGNVVANSANIQNWTYVPQLWFKGTLSAAQNIVSSTDTVTIWNTNTDPQSWGNVTTGRIVPNKPGWYEITSRVQFNAEASANSQQQINHQIAVNGNQQAISSMPNLTANIPVTIITTAMANLNGTTDYITTTCYSSLAGNIQQINGGNTSMVLVRWVST